MNINRKAVECAAPHTFREVALVDQSGNNVCTFEIAVLLVRGVPVDSIDRDLLIVVRSEHISGDSGGEVAIKLLLVRAVMPNQNR